MPTNAKSLCMSKATWSSNYLSLCTSILYGAWELWQNENCGCSSGTSGHGLIKLSSLQLKPSCIRRSSWVEKAGSFYFCRQCSDAAKISALSITGMPLGPSDFNLTNDSCYRFSQSIIVALTGPPWSPWQGPDDKNLPPDTDCTPCTLSLQFEA